MNDYLNNLAARSLNPAPALQPRLRSQFEPAPQDGLFNTAQSLTAAPEDAAFDAATEIESEPSPVESRRAPVRRTTLIQKGESVALASREAVTTPRPKLPESVAASADTASITGMQAQPQRTIRPVESATQLQPATPAAAAAAQDRNASLDRPLAETVEQKKIDSPLQSLRRTNDEEARHHSIRPGVRTIIREQVLFKDALGRVKIEPGAIQAPVAETEEQSRQPGQPLILSSFVAQPHVTPLFEDRGEDRFARDDQPPAPPAPAINVTIGRIEVRAMQSTSPSSPKQRPAQPMMSLDEYLRQRSSGGTR